MRGTEGRSPQFPGPGRRTRQRGKGAWGSQLLESAPQGERETVGLLGPARPGAQGAREIVRRLSEILLIEVLRASIDRDASPGALTAFSDPALRRALEQIHAAPGEAWTLPRLAARAGVSRSVLSDRFRATLGTSPMRYLASWRLEKARHLLDRRELGIGEIAAAVGYASEAAFNRAFKEAHGAPPGRLRASRARASHGRVEVAR